MSSYYFLVASLPSLSLEEPPALTSAGLHALCNSHLNARDMAGLEELRDDSNQAPRHPFTRAWRQIDTQLRNATARARAAARGIDAERYLRPVDSFDAGAETTAAEAYATPSPLDRERVMDRFRWERLGDLAGLDPFSGSAVLAYAGKLAISERWAGMNEDTGMERQRTLVADRAAGRNAGDEGSPLSDSDTAPDT